VHSFVPLLVLGREGGVSAEKKPELPKRVSLNALRVGRANPPALAGKKRQSLVAVADVIEQLHAARFLRIYQNRRLADGLDRFSKIESKKKTKQNKKKTETKGGCTRASREEKKARTISKTSSTGNPRNHRHHDLFLPDLLLLFWSKYYRERSTRHLCKSRFVV